MGQRLVTIFTKDNEECMVTYHHWSGYTILAIDFAAACLGLLERTKKETGESAKIEDVISAMVEQKLISGVDEESQKILAKKGTEIPLQTDRNTGLCSIEEEGMEDSKKWAEMIITIDMDNKTADIADIFGWLEFYNFAWGCDVKADDGLLDEINEIIEYDFENTDSMDDRIELLETCRNMNPEVVDTLIEELEKLNKSAIFIGYDLTAIEYSELKGIISEVKSRDRRDILYFKTGCDELVTEIC